MAYEKKADTAYEPTKATHPGKLGDHPLGGAVGGAVGGLAGGAAVVGAVKGAAAGAVAGPLGIASGAIAGAAVGALVGKGIAQEVNPTTEDAYWRNHYNERPYVTKGTAYDTYQPAYRHGVESYGKYEGRSFDEVEPEMRDEWESLENTTLPWDQAKLASRDAYERLHQRSTLLEDEGEIEDADEIQG